MPTVGYTVWINSALCPLLWLPALSEECNTSRSQGALVVSITAGPGSFLQSLGPLPVKPTLIPETRRRALAAPA